ncbi:PfkB family carbohydrate kinase, partial [Escherichia coli]|nr:PfkB family carbohydrate kinase [Escherichia coli]
MASSSRSPSCSAGVTIESGGGPAANAAWLLGLWGEEVYYIGHLQQDLYGQRIIDEFAEAGVDTSQVVFSDDMI